MKSNFMPVYFIRIDDLVVCYYKTDADRKNAHKEDVDKNADRKT
jgi:hypothetical protein